MKVLHSTCQPIWKTLQWPQDWKTSVFIPILEKGSAKKCSNYLTIALISHTSKVILKILQARLQQYLNCELPDVQAGFRKCTGTRNQIANICWIIEKARKVPEKHLLLHYLLRQSLSLCESESEVTQSCPTLYDPVDCSLPGSSIHGISQARILEWVAISFSRGSFWPRDRTHVSHIAGRCFANYGKFFQRWEY